MIKFLSDDGYKRIVKSIVKSFGVVMPNINSDNFRVNENDTSSISVNPGVAFDSNLNAIINNSLTVIPVANNNINNWVKISYSTSKIEMGTVNVTNNGTVVGVGTSFTKIFRGQPNYPTKIKLVSSVNTGEYEIVKVVDDTNMFISGDLQTENDLQFSVIGCFAPGFQASPNNREIYEYDSCTITLVNSAAEPVIIRDSEFLLARVYYDENNILRVEDIRSNYVFNSEYSSGQYKPMTAPLVSLMSWSKNVNGFWTLVLDHGYKIITYQINQTETGTVITITSGTSNYWQSQTPSVNFFSGWRLINRTNMASCLIDSSNGRDLVSSDWSNSILTGVNDLVLIPNWTQIEYEITHNPDSANVKNTTYQTFNVSNIIDVMIVPQLIRNVDADNYLRVRYRLINGYESTPFRNLAIVGYVKNDGTQALMPSDSVFPVDDTDEGSSGGGGGSPGEFSVAPSQIILSNTSSTSRLLTVTAPDNTWSVDSSTESWIAVTKANNTSIRVEINENTDELARFYTIVVKWRDMVNTINVEQAGTAGTGGDFYVTPDMLNIGSTGETDYPISVIAPNTWSIDAISVTWLTATVVDQNSFNVTVQPNTDTAARDYTLTLICGNATTSLWIYQEAPGTGTDFTVSPTTIEPDNGNAYGASITVTAPDNTWIVSGVSESWVKCTKTNDTTANLTLTANNSGGVRHGWVEFKWGLNNTQMVYITQPAMPPELTIVPYQIDVRYNTTRSITVNISNVIGNLQFYYGNAGGYLDPYLTITKISNTQLRVDTRSTANWPGPNPYIEVYVQVYTETQNVNQNTNLYVRWKTEDFLFPQP